MSFFADAPWDPISEAEQTRLTKDRGSDFFRSGLDCWLVEVDASSTSGSSGSALGVDATGDSLLKEIALQLRPFNLEFSYRFSDTYDDLLLDSLAAGNPLRWSAWHPGVEKLITKWYKASEKKGLLNPRLGRNVNRIDVRVRVRGRKAKELSPNMRNLLQITDRTDFLKRMKDFLLCSCGSPDVSGVCFSAAGATGSSVDVEIDDEENKEIHLLVKGSETGPAEDMKNMATFLERLVDAAMEPGSGPGSTSSLTLERLSRIKQIRYSSSQNLPELVVQFRKEWNAELRKNEAEKNSIIGRLAALRWVKLGVLDSSSRDAEGWPSWKLAMLAEDGWKKRTPPSVSPKKFEGLPSGFPAIQDSEYFRHTSASSHYRAWLVEAPLQPILEEWQKIDCGVEDSMIRAVEQEIAHLQLEFSYRNSDTWEQGTILDRLASLKINRFRWSTHRPLFRRIKGWYSASSQKRLAAPPGADAELNDEAVNRVDVQVRSRRLNVPGTDFKNVNNAAELLQKIKPWAESLPRASEAPADRLVPVRKKTRLVIGIQTDAYTDDDFKRFWEKFIEDKYQYVGDHDHLYRIEEVFWYVFSSSAEQPSHIDPLPNFIKDLRPDSYDDDDPVAVVEEDMQEYLTTAE